MSVKSISGEDIIGRNIYIIPVERSSPQEKDRGLIGIGGKTKPRNTGRPSGSQYTLCFEINHTVKSVNSGMTGLIDNPYTDPTEVPSQWIEHTDELVNKKKLTIQEYMEVLNNVPKGSYTPISTVYSMSEIHSDRSKLKDSKHTTLTNFKYFLDYTNITPLFWERPRDRLAIFAAYMSQKIANSRAEVNPSYHDFYIGNESESLDKKKEVRKTKTKAVSLLNGILESNVFTQYQFAVLLKIGRGEMTPNAIYDELSNYIWADKQINGKSNRQRIQEFIDLHERFTNSPEKFHIDYLVNQAINTRVFVLSDNAFYWISQRDSNEALYKLGYNLDRFKAKLKQEKELLTPETEDQNIYHMFLTELEDKNVRLA